jgi:uncharacterized repeat protein (TIGR01451 family)
MSRGFKAGVLSLVPRISFLLILVLMSAAAGEQTLNGANQTTNDSINGQWTLFEDNDKALSASPVYMEITFPEQSSIGPADVTFNLQNNSPLKEIRNIVTANDTPKSFRLQANDANNSLLKFEIIVPPAHGSIGGAAPNLLYLPEKNYSGKDSFGIGVEDENGNKWNISASIDIVQLYHPPSVRIRTPQNGMIFAYDPVTYLLEIPIQVTASGQAISEVQIWVDMVLMDTIDCAGASSCPATYILSDPLYGKHTILAKAVDSMGATCTSLPVVIIVNPPEPQVKIISPSNGQIFTSPAKISIAAQVIDGHPIETVEFYANSQKIGEATDVPYRFDWPYVDPGVYYLAAVATDDQGNSAISPSILAIVVPPQPLSKADLALTLSSSPNPIRKRSNFNYYLLVTNRGPNSATNVFVNDLLPEGLVYVSYGASQGKYDNETGIWDIGGLTKYRSAKLVITARVPIDAQPGQIANEAEVAGSERDPNNSNNYAITYTKIRG